MSTMDPKLPKKDISSKKKKLKEQGDSKSGEVDRAVPGAIMFPPHTMEAVTGIRDNFVHLSGQMSSLRDSLVVPIQNAMAPILQMGATIKSNNDWLSLGKPDAGITGINVASSIFTPIPKDKTQDAIEALEKKFDESAKNRVVEVPKNIYSFEPKMLIASNPLEQSSYLATFAEKISKTGSWLDWSCAFCGKYMDVAPRLENLAVIERYYKQFAEGKYESCPACESDNFFIIQKDHIIFSCVRSLIQDPAEFVSRAGKKKPIDKKTNTD